ncbi:MAG: hypothetical protein KDB14_15505 [Planctomycetales bacterium]|nr:hypothetical protein [Planctomycetales bacterium]
MPARTSAQIPSYRLHKPTGRGVVRLNGRDIYLGEHGTPESKERYRQVIAEWLANMLSGELPYEQRGRIRYARVSDVEAWEESRLTRPAPAEAVWIHPDLLEYA